MNHEPTTQDILDAINTFATSVDRRFEDVAFEFKGIKDSMVTKDELKTELSAMENRINNQIDGFVTLHNTMDVELVSVRNRCDRMESFIDKAAKKLDIEYSR